MQQVVDLQNSKQFTALGVELLSVSPDSTEDWKSEAARMRITLPLLSDRDAKIAEAYGVMQWAMGNEPGHTFVLVDKTGRVAWIKDFGAPEHGGLMYVSPPTLVQAIQAHMEK